MSSAIEQLTRRLEQGARPVNVPRRSSFREFLVQDARVPDGRGGHGHYSFTGREALAAIVVIIDQVLAEALSDSTVALAGGAQFGKTILELNFIAYMTSQRFQNAGLYLPDDDLVEGVVDAKFRPDVLDQIDWFARMTQVGKAVNKSGKAVNRKGAFLVTDGERKAVGMIRGLGKVPTTFSMDTAAMDEVDDIQPRMEKFVKGRLSASKLRFILKIGTQRIHGRGMNQAWKDGSQGVVELKCPNPQCEKRHNPEESFPQIIRCAVADSLPRPLGGEGWGEGEIQTRTDDPMLTWTADFRRAGDETIVAVHDPRHYYYLACPHCGAELDRSAPQWTHRQPEQIRLRNWSFRISQLSIAAIDLSQVVAHWSKAVEDPEEMVVFRCDRLALPQSTSQALTPDILDRARRVETFDLTARVRPGCQGFGGLDMGDRCFYIARERDSFETVKAAESLTEPGRRIIAVEQIASANVVSRAQFLFAAHGLSVLFVDQRPLVNESRTIALALNGLLHLARWPKVPEKDAHLTLPGGLAWDGRVQQWKNLRCAVVRFDKKKIGAGIAHTFDVFEHAGQEKFVPCIDCNRFETIDRVVREFLTPAENVIDVIPNLGVRQQPAMRLPRRLPGSPPILEVLDTHLITGSERVKEKDGTLGDYVDACENHLLLAAAYSALAETVGAPRHAVTSGAWTAEALKHVHMGGNTTAARFTPRTLKPGRLA
jgi:hypothetical protein